MIATLRLFAAVTATLALAAVVVPAASAGTIAVAQPCVRAESPVGFSLSGYAPGYVEIQLDGSYLSEVDTEESGAFTGSFPAPSLGSARAESHTVSTPQGGSATFSVTPTGATQKPAYPKPTGKVTLDAYGFVEGGALYAHYVHHPTDVKYTLNKTVALGKLTGACGNLKKKVAALPVKKPKPGVWIVQVDNRKAYKKQVAPSAELSVYVAKKAK